MVTKSQVPRGLKARGKAFWTFANSMYELNRDELELLAECCRVLDVLEGLDRAIRDDGLMIAGSMGQPRVHPAVAEARSNRLVLGRLVAQLALPDPKTGDTVPKLTAIRGQRAAGARWDRFHEQWGAGDDDGTSAPA